MPEWWEYFGELRRSRGVSQDLLGHGWRERERAKGRDRTFISKAEHGRVRNPPSQVALYYIARALNLSINSPQMLRLAELCHGADSVAGIAELWAGMREQDRLRTVAEAIPDATVRELCTATGQLDPRDPVYGYLHLRIIRAAERSGHGAVIKRFFRGDIT